MDLNEIKNTGIGAAYNSAKILCDYYGSLNHIEKKGPNDLVTEADLASQNAIIQAIQAKFPDHGILAEENGYDQMDAGDCRWIIDPLDGTTNFTHQIPIFCISIAFAVNGKTRVGIVLNPVSGELFTAAEGQGAALNGRPIKVSGQSDISESLLVTGFPYAFQAIIQPVMQRFQQCLLAARGIRRLGSAALDLCYVACGRFEAFWEENLHPWDTAAGTVIAEMAGGRVTDFSGHPFSIDKKEILATNGHIHEAVRSLLTI